ncbi:MAG: hemerythrin domain-containing protein [Nocardioidaceae bacterium]|nr:hemerythrin domain-containing protein [Nocardioidaceae bacterium]
MSTELPGWDESTRPHAPSPGHLDAHMQAQGGHLRAIHDMYRSNLSQVRSVLDRIGDGALDVGEARAAVNQVGLRATYEQLGSFCGQMCQMVEVHHSIEDAHMYPALAATPSGDALAPVLGRLAEEHLVVHAMLVRLDEVLVVLPDAPERIGEVQVLFEHLQVLLESHFTYEEDELCDPLGYHGVMV